MTDEEIKALQNRILEMEGEIRTLKNSKKPNQTEIEALTKEREDLKKELEEMKAKFWDGKDRRAKERREIRKETPAPKDALKDEESIYSGHF